ncbi:N-acyl-D-amino-acid deacylase family protein [Mycobacterium sp. 94-17]|uniref:N-acyl-D-amino-acid deacylase family protein n=1 Tax=Mycobacterium sp. 94-17 TaxID=2986147 RepID=UPI002D1E9331|nr:amidohydrolase family protein [Mycobacterium sp. 94-17]MEB4208659.1 amidohydrolase family protein [Mycobacterium sp. 94-17]
MHDVVIRGGKVADGTGEAAYTADVAVTDGRIVEVGRVSGSARRTIDADGLLVTPGFVDIHTHYDGQATWDPHLTPSCWHGVTTAILGNCGVGFAPVAAPDRQRLVELMEGVEDIPGTALYEGIQWDWESFPEYLDALERAPHALDIGAQVPHAAVRAYVMGERALEDATPDDIDAMTRIVAESLAAGAVGFSTGRTQGHRDVHGNPVPGTFAAEEELEALYATMAAAGRGVFEVVPAGVGGVEGLDPEGALDGELEWIVRLGQSAPVPLTFLIMQPTFQPDSWRPHLKATHEANANGANIRPQIGSRCFSALVGHQSRLNPFKYTEAYQRISHLPLSELIVQLRQPQIREAILSQAPQANKASTSLDRMSRQVFERLFPLGDTLDYEPTADKSVAAIARQNDRDPWHVTYDLMLGSEGRDFLLFPLLNYGKGSYDGLYDMMSDPLTVQGLGDGGAHSSIVCDASMTTYLLTYWTRDRSRGPRLPLEYAVRRLTSDGADLYGLHDRGRIRAGLRADLNVIDYQNLALVHPERVTDLPGGAGRLVQRSNGYIATLVAGDIVVEGGELTDARPGRLIRSGR